MSEIFYYKNLNKNEHLRRVKKVLERGGNIILPTDTIYGIIADAFNEEGVNNIFKIKKRDKGKKFLILVKSIEEMEKYIDKKNYNKMSKIINLLSKYAVTFICKAKENLPEYIVKDGNIAIRIPKVKYLQKLLFYLDNPVVAPSANISGEKDIRWYKDLIKIFSDKVEVIYYKLYLWNIKPSTIVDISGNSIDITRKGVDYKFIKKIIKSIDI